MKTTDKFVFFWGNQDIYSNFYNIFFKHQQISFKCSEQAVMYRKAILFGAGNIAEQILQAKSAKECKRLGRSREMPFDDKVWEDNRERIYKEVLLDKFTVAELKRKLLETGDKVLVEASPYDKIWGIGMADDHPDAMNPSKWKGLNLLGKVLMEVRKELKTLDSNYK